MGQVNEWVGVRAVRSAAAMTVLLAVGAASRAHPHCGNLNGDSNVESTDLGILLADFGCVGDDCDGDVDHDGDTDQADLAWLLVYWDCGYAGRPPCGLCEPWGSGTIDVSITPVDNSHVGPGDDPYDPDFYGGVTHFTLDLITTITGDNDWTTQSSRAELNAGGVEFYQHPELDSDVPRRALWGVFPALEFDSFWSAPEFDSPGFAGVTVTTPTLLERTWFDTRPDAGESFTSQRITIVIEEDSGIVPSALLSDCNDLFPVLGHVTTDATSSATGADFLHREFDIVDAAHPDCPGDVDGDADVDQTDLGILLAAYGIDDGGDLDGDGDTDQADLGILLGAYGTMCGEDCNENGIVDLIEFVRGDALDLNGNCILDVCE